MELDKTHVIMNAEYALYKAGLQWITNNNGVHLQIFKAGKRAADLWPTTGKWSIPSLSGNRALCRKGFGVEQMIKELDKWNGNK